MESLAPLFVVSMDLLYHVFIFSAIFSHKVSELNSNFSEGTWTPELTAGVTITQGGGYYYKIGKLVYCNVVIWLDTSQATDEELTITLPFTSDHERSYGTVGYINPLDDFPNLCVGIRNKGNKAQLIYGDTSGATATIKGNQITIAIQFTLTYVTT